MSHIHCPQREDTGKEILCHISALVFGEIMHLVLQSCFQDKRTYLTA